MCLLSSPFLSFCNAKAIAASLNHKSCKSKSATHPCHAFVSSPNPPSSPARLHPSSLNARCCSSSPALFTDMDGRPSSSLLPLQRCKILHLVRHAQGIHNVEGEKDHSAYMSPELFDAHLTPLGWNQVDNLHRHVIACGLNKKIDLVITSPLLRTMQTAVGVFGGEALVDGVKGRPLMVENAGNSGRPAISSLDSPPFVAVEACREHLGVHPCDKRRTIREYQTLFPAIDFSLIESNEDILWEPNVREPNEEVAIRGMKFFNWLLTRRETEIAVITHSGFLFHTLRRFGKDFHPLIKDEICKQ
ncbi:phosphoglycerate mutase-like protein 2 [Phalaenopsis equestris]|uniref:phosphoglycerate mutase-like protein 2 n=1 Tax=Phalaenopsis equestris TaxID=78828 RepID=UPI0009E3E465|nr:phosphoglycerate mutase-like protein 2 [Phalaenopsis equestris]